MTTHRMFRFSTICTALFVLAGLGCSKKEEDSLPSALGSAAPPASQGAPLQAVQPEAPGAPASCSVESEKVWTQTPGLGTGMTSTVFADGRVAVGLNLGGRPHVVVFDKAGQGDAVAVPLAQDLKNGPAKGAKRTLARVTPGLGSGGAIMAFADYLDESDDHRRVVCSPTDSEKHLLEFDGKPLISRAATEETSKPAEPEKAETAAQAPAETAGTKPVAETAPIAQPPAEGPVTPKGNRYEAAGDSRRSRAFDILRKRREQAAAAAGASATPTAPAVPAEPAPSAPPPAAEPAAAPSAGPAEAPATKPESGKAESPKGSAGKKPVVELRSCRTLVDPGGEHSWTVGSELSQDEQKDGSFEYSMVFFAEREFGRGRSKLLEKKLGPEPQTLHTFDAVSAAEVSPGTFALTARYRGTLHAWALDAQKRPIGTVRTYAGGYPSPVRFAQDRGAFGLTSQQVAGEYGLRLLAIGEDNALPSALGELMIPGGGASKTEPSFARVGDHRFLGYVAGPPGQGSFQMVPVDARLGPLAPAFKVAPDDAVVEAQLFALSSGKVLAVYLRGGAKPAFVSKVLTCG